MSAQSPSEGQPPPKKKGLTPVQIGAGVGAAAALLFLMALRELSRPVVPHGGAGGVVSNLLLGVWGAVGAMAGMAVVALVSFIRRRKKKADVQDRAASDAGSQPAAAAPPAPGPQAEAGGNGIPILRVVAGVAALVFAGVPALMAIHGRLALVDLALMGALGFMCAWYAVRGRKGLPRFLTKTSDLHNPAAPPEEAPTSSKPRPPRKWSGLLLFLGILYVLAGTNAELQDAVGRGPLGSIQLVGLAIVIWAGVSLKRAKPIRPWVLPVVGAPLILFAILAIFFSPEPVAAHVERGNTYMTQGEFDKAIDEFTKAITMAPKLAVPYYNRGNAYLKSEDPDKAIADYSRAIEIDPRKAQYYNNRGAAHLVAENYQAAVADFTEAIRLNGRLAQAYFGRSIALAELGETARSEADLARARELDPKIPRE